MKPDIGYLSFTDFDGDNITLPKAETAVSQDIPKKVAFKNLEIYAKQLKASHPSKNKLKKLRVERKRYEEAYKAKEAKEKAVKEAEKEAVEEKVEAASWFSWLPSLPSWS